MLVQEDVPKKKRKRKRMWWTVEQEEGCEDRIYQLMSVERLRRNHRGCQSAKKT